jgi:hypothetical protein
VVEVAVGLLSKGKVAGIEELGMSDEMKSTKRLQRYRTKRKRCVKELLEGWTWVSEEWATDSTWKGKETIGLVEVLVADEGLQRCAALAAAGAGSLVEKRTAS